MWFFIMFTENRLYLAWYFGLVLGLVIGLVLSVVTIVDNPVVNHSFFA